jgi:hypothetical protein
MLRKEKRLIANNIIFDEGKLLLQKMNMLRVYALFSAFSQVGHRTC